MADRWVRGMVAAPFESLFPVACLLRLIYVGACNQIARSSCNISYKTISEIAGGELFVRQHGEPFLTRQQHKSIAAGVEASERGKGR